MAPVYSGGNEIARVGPLRNTRFKSRMARGLVSIKGLPVVNSDVIFYIENGIVKFHTYTTQYEDVRHTLRPVSFE